MPAIQAGFIQRFMLPLIDALAPLAPAALGAARRHAASNLAHWLAAADVEARDQRLMRSEQSLMGPALLAQASAAMAQAPHGTDAPA